MYVCMYVCMCLSVCMYVYVMYLCICLEDGRHCSILISVSNYKEGIPIPTLKDKLPFCRKRNMYEEMSFYFRS